MKYLGITYIITKLNILSHVELHVNVHEMYVLCLLCFIISIVYDYYVNVWIFRL